VDKKVFRKVLKEFIQENKLILVIFLVGFFLRIYRLSELFQFGHEQDLQAWIVKDILIDKHPRLIGQETSITGLFIGPLYYYMLVPFFFLFNLNPLSSYIPMTFISMATLFSVYYVLKKLYGRTPAIIGSLVYAVSPSIVFLDRWVVPTQLTLLWTIWFYYVLINFVRGNLRTTPILIVLLGLIWHIHVAFIPLLLLLPMAIYLSKIDSRAGFKKVNKRNLKLSVIALAILALPFLAFEFRHNFQQVRGVFGVNTTREGQAKELRGGVYKLEVITEYVNQVVWSPLVYEVKLKSPMIAKIPILLLIFLGAAYFVYKRSQFTKKETIMIYLWILITVVGQMFSQRIISQYYFNNLIIISLVIFALTASNLYERGSTKNLFIVAVLAFVFFSTYQVMTKPKLVGEYKDKSAVVEFIADDYFKNGYSCAGINFIGDIPVRFGYRFLFWRARVSQVSPGNDVPVYSIVQPFTISESETRYSSGDIGVILPQNENIDESVCIQPERQLLPLNGFVN
jgi:4-amino-4-deoxy-L-arabinose transferase-like glycosyltransferase